MNSSHLMRGRLSCALIASLLIFGPSTAIAQTHPVQTSVDMEVPAEPSTAPVTMTMALDASDAPTYLASHVSEIEVAQKAWPKIVFNELREHSGAPFKKTM